MAQSPPLAELEPRRICLIKPSALGDIVQTLPVLSGLRQRWPDAHIAWVVHRGLIGLLDGHPQLNEVIPFDRGVRGLPGLRATGRLARQLSRGRFDLAIDLQGLLRSGLMTAVTWARRRVGFANAREYAPLFYTDRISVQNMEQSAVSRYWLVAEALGCPGQPPAAELGITSAVRAAVREKLSSLPRPWLAIHPGAQWQTKRWPPVHFAEIARRAHREFGAGIVLVGGPGEGGLAAQIAERLSGPFVNLAEQTRLLELAAVLEASDVTCSGDTGPMHLAAAVGSRVVGVFTCTSPVRAAPYGPGQRVVATSVHCAASYLKKCSSMICMDELTPHRVWPSVCLSLRDASEMPLRNAS